jgi:mannose-1-phosphate guanylyltransferase
MPIPSNGFGSSGRASGTVPLPSAARAGDEQGAPAMWAVVFAGGIGSRFWPLATPASPKPVLALVGGRPLIAETVGRLDPLIPADRVLVVTSADIAPAVRSVLPSVPPGNFLVEARPMGTAAALAWGASEVRRRGDPNTPVCALHADLAAAFPSALRAGLQRAAFTALSERALVAVGVRPTRAEASFGYLQAGEPLDSEEGLDRGGAADVAQFTEKPGPNAAAALVRGGALWHSGIVVGAAQEFLDALQLYVPEVAPGLTALASGDVELFASLVRPVGIERGLLERIGRLLVIAPEFGWDDVGTWAGLRRVRELDDTGNGALGAAHFVDATGNVVHAEEGTVVMFGVSQLLVVTRPGLTFITTLERAADLDPLLDSLPGSARINPTSLGE